MNRFRSFPGQYDDPSRFRIVSILVVSIVLVSLILSIMNLQKGREQINRAAAFEVESHAKLVASQINAGFSRADTLVRLSIEKLQGYSFSEEIPSGSVLDRYLKRELLLTPYVRFMVILDSEENILWRSPGAPREDQGLKHSVNIHRETGVRFMINHHINPAMPHSEHVHLSRSIRGDDGSLLVIVDAILDIETLMPSVGDPYYRDSIEMRLLDKDLETVLVKNFSERKAGSGEWLNRMIEQGKDNVIRGGFHVLVGDWWVAGLYQVESFPYFAMAVISLEEEIDAWQRGILQTLSLVFSFGILIWLIAVAALQLMQNRRIKQYSDKLEKTNEQIQKTSEERKLLLQEIHHRVKNNLSLITSIINLIVMQKGPFDESTFKDLGARITAIQNVHDTLYSGDNLSRVPVNEYLKGLVETIVPTLCPFDVSIDIHVDEFYLKPRKTIPLGVITVEVVTNAVKYGLVAGGRIYIEGGRINETEVLIRFCNNGRPYREAPPGLGTLVIQSLTEQLNGSFSRENGTDTCFRLAFPLEEDPRN
ncbi:histidine kinase dimerization/phosphoacceptor domain -containing protein [Marispirochaeta sp.]|uniref:sensor histidine kinase n=1 Tax=Marispirochaeta sp. TaxID=2038653 RepID=UPI0029C6AC10|nr:histidine kinase dimerization/phosphoacceptor domain -containing protein [Marispirochaeta sp.]